MEKVTLARKERERLAEEKNARIRQKLEMVIDVDFPKGATLEDVLKHIKQATTDENFSGIPIYVDPVGLGEASKSMASVVHFDGKQRTVSSLLSGSLTGTGLSYCVRDGWLMVSSRVAIVESRVEEIDRKLDRVLEMLGRLQPPK